MSVGRWVSAMTLAIVKVFPDPVTPKSAVRGAFVHALDQLANGLGLIPGRLKGTVQLERS